MFVLLLFACASKTSAPASAVKPEPSSPVGFLVTGVAELEVGDQVEICTNEAAIFQAGPYSCGPAMVAVVEGPLGPTVLEKDLVAAVQTIGLDPSAEELYIMSFQGGVDPSLTTTSGRSFTKGSEGGMILIGNTVHQTSVGTKVIFVSKRP